MVPKASLKRKEIALRSLHSGEANLKMAIATFSRAIFGGILEHQRNTDQ
jgi:hypothetical protein